MAHEIRVRLHPDDAPTDASTQYENWRDSYRPILAEQSINYRSVPARGDGTRPAYDEFRVFFDQRDDRASILTDLVDNYFPTVSWFVVHARRNDAELSDPTYATDPDYHDPDLVTGLRADVTIERSGVFTVAYDAIDYRIDGADYTVPSGEYTASTPESPTTTTLYATINGEVATTGEVPVADLTTHPGKIVSITPAKQPQTTDDWGTPHTTRGDPPTPFVDSTESFPDPVPLDERIGQLEQATGIGGQGKQGIAQRIDDIEGRLDDLESYH